ncbi:hypothetical protein U1Q18_040159 [Sarracenia purpurea var. burkii]
MEYYAAGMDCICQCCLLSWNALLLQILLPCNANAADVTQCLVAIYGGSQGQSLIGCLCQCSPMFCWCPGFLLVLQLQLAVDHLSHAWCCYGLMGHMLGF